VFAALEEAIIQQYPEIYHENLQSVFPPWDYFQNHTVEEFKAENCGGEVEWRNEGAEQG